MKLPEKQIEDYKKYRDHGDGVRLKKMLGIKSTVNMYNILDGKVGTSPERIGKIVKFINLKKKQHERINQEAISGGE